MKCRNKLSDVVARAFYTACCLDVEAYKPGNVSLFAPGHGMRAQDFLHSASASAPVMGDPGLSLGERIFHAVAASRTAVGCNTNLGIVLLAAPLAQAMLESTPRGDLAERVKQILRQTRRADAHWAYRAIRLADPGGLGRVPEHDVGYAPRVNLRTAMVAAAHRDRIAHLYATDFSDIFQVGAPRFVDFRRRWRDDAWAAVALYLELLARTPDTHIVRKQGETAAVWVTARAAQISHRLMECAWPQVLLRELYMLDSDLKLAGINPGTTADLTVAAIMAAKLLGLNGSAEGSSAPDVDRGNVELTKIRSTTF